MASTLSRRVFRTSPFSSFNRKKFPSNLQSGLLSSVFESDSVRLLSSYGSREQCNVAALCPKRGLIYKDFGRGTVIRPKYGFQNFNFGWIHFGRFLCTALGAPESGGGGGGSIAVADGSGQAKEAKVKRKKLKGKRAVVRWLKFFRWKKKKEFQRMTAEEKLVYKLRKARKKEERLLEALEKIEPKETSEATHDPEILTPEEHFYFLKMGQKCKNYVPVGRRGIYQGVILNMHLHWKRHQTLKVVVKTFSPEEVKEIAAELARLSGGIILDIQDDNTIIMYRGKNYAQPPTEIMSPRSTLSRNKALNKSKYRDALRAVRRYIPRLEQDLELLRAQAENKASLSEENQLIGSEDYDSDHHLQLQTEATKKLNELMPQNGENDDENDSMMESDLGEDSEDLSDIFETESEEENEERNEKPLYLNAFEKFPVYSNGETDDFEEHLRQISANSRKEKLQGRDVKSPDLDEVDRMILQAASLLKKNRR
ncbi:uncharacterized CRM domain-containing protein At3g25440, chloroplastic [Ipomoea triloba]|uniref:uncharacterized CRM domain-containing protein At3g25440, chloroplastic n=1 Tax=Ipomoea triloba TaxID=35885 RepID=UPI00125D0604|nr:uncharacterized CRM domain-containing protein At3g25440, chloroplastic [Ipomoea triloba]XP_031097947.1 uncharacterized CRM domain-containing protein At3g25440, chloroplastic [Ipomoea triloba]